LKGFPAIRRHDKKNTMPNSAPNLRRKIRQRLFKPEDAASLAVFRIGFGLIMLWEVWRYWRYGWIERYYIEPRFHFKYFGFEWVEPWPGEWMYAHFALVGVLAAFIALGFLYRLSTHLFVIAFSYLFLLEQAHYLNHLYLVVLVSLILCMVPANRYLAVDAWRKPRQRVTTVPAWSIWLLRAQFEVVYIYAGIVKLNQDWLQLEPLSMWLAGRSDLPVLGDLFLHDWAVAIGAYGIIVLHMLGAPLLLWRRTRLAVFAIYAGFHVLNHFLFNIGIFPWLTLFATLIFFDPDWPKQVWRHISALVSPGRTSRTPRVKPVAAGIAAFPPPTRSRQNLILGAIAVWLAYQILMPLRHVLYPGNVGWTEEGHRYAWQMKLRDKRGRAEFIVRDRHSGRTWRVDPSIILTRRQAQKMAVRPDMIVQFAHYLADRWKLEYTGTRPAVYVISRVSLNGRKPAAMIDPSVDLAGVERSIRKADWILPLTEPLNRSPEKYRPIY